MNLSSIAFLLDEIITNYVKEFCPHVKINITKNVFFLD